MHVLFDPPQYPWLGRQIVHDERSRNFARAVTVDRSTWITKSLRIYDPLPNPNQSIGNCTGVSKCVQFNTAGNRRPGVVFNMLNANRIYSQATKIDPFPGTWPDEDTGSSGLAAAKAAQVLGVGGEYRWLFGGADEVVQTIMSGIPVSVGTWWYEAMFSTDSRGFTMPLGDRVGGHQWTVRGYDKSRDEIIGRCWWGTYRDFRLRRTDLADLLADDGDAHVQKIVG